MAIIKDIAEKINSFSRFFSPSSWCASQSLQGREESLRKEHHRVGQRLIHLCARQSPLPLHSLLRQLSAALQTTGERIGQLLLVRLQQLLPAFLLLHHGEEGLAERSYRFIDLV